MIVDQTASLTDKHRTDSSVPPSVFDFRCSGAAVMRAAIEEFWFHDHQHHRKPTAAGSKISDCKTVMKQKGFSQSTFPVALFINCVRFALMI